jgi:hypothetical protein
VKHILHCCRNRRRHGHLHPPCRTSCAAGAPSYRHNRAAACSPASFMLCRHCWPRHTYTCVRVHRASTRHTSAGQTSKVMDSAHDTVRDTVSRYRCPATHKHSFTS